MDHDEATCPREASTSLDAFFLALPHPTLSAPPPLASTENVPRSNTSKLKNCAACRIRRVKCERLPGETSCVKCIAKGLVCTQLPPKVRKTPNRTGNRIEATQALFGDVSAAQTPIRENDAAIAGPIAKRRREASPWLPRIDSRTSTVAKLVTGELEASLTGSLLELYDSLPANNRIPLFEATSFQIAFESNGRKLEGLDARLQVLSSVILALAARVSDHPLLVGGGGPTANELRQAVQDGSDLSRWGEKRVDACRALVARANELADAKGVWREATVENLVTLMMLEGMSDCESATKPSVIDPGRPLGAAYMQHLRSILSGSDQESKDRVMTSGLAWTAFGRDAIMSAMSGQTSVFSDDDCFLLGPHLPISVQQALQLPDQDLFAVEGIASMYHTPFWNLFSSLLWEVSTLARESCVKLSGLRATHGPRIDEAFVQRFLQAMQLINRGFQELDRRIPLYLDRSPHGVRDLGHEKDVFDSVQQVRIVKTGLAFLLHRIVAQRSADHDATRNDLSSATSTQAARILKVDGYEPLEGPSRSEDAEYWDRFDLIRERARDLAFDAARERANLLATIGSTGLPLGALSFKLWPLWIVHLVDMPSLEEGGQRLDWSLAAKIACLRTVLRAVNAMGWAYPSISRPAPWLKSIVDQLEHRHNSTISTFPLDFASSVNITSGLHPGPYFANSLANPIAAAPSASDLPFMSDSEITSILDGLGGYPGPDEKVAGVELELSRLLLPRLLSSSNHLDGSSSDMVSCQKCRQPISPASFPRFDAHQSRPPHPEDSIAALSPSTYDFLSHSERYQHPHAGVPASIRPYYNAAVHHHRSTPSTSSRPTAVQRVTVPGLGTPPNPRLPPHLGPAESFVVLTDSVFRPPPSPSSPAPAPSPSLDSTSAAPNISSDPSAQPTSLNSRLTQLSHLSSLLSSSSSIDHPLCTECADTLVLLMQNELEEGKKERDRLIAFEKEAIKKREDAKRDGTELTREGLEKDIAKLKKAEQVAITELKSIEATKEALEAEMKALDLEEEELAAQEAQFWTEHSKYVIERDVLQDRQNSLTTRLANSQKELDKLQRTNVYNDTFCIGQESTLGTINSLRLGRLPTISPPVEWSEINAALGHTLLLLQTISIKFGMRGFVGWRLQCKGSFSRIVKVEDGGKEGESYELIVKDKIGDVSIKCQFGSDETWSRALRHVLLDLKILLGRASI
ncbi:hypothetical protein JCM11491_006273 [Sporobolomyces phaffii]